MIKRIIFFREHRFNLRDYQRLGIELLQKNGFHVEVWDLTPVLHPKLFKEYVPQDVFSYEGLTLFNDRGTMCEKVCSLSDSDFVIDSIGYHFRSLGLYRALSKSPAPYAVNRANNVPFPRVKKGWLELLEDKFKKLIAFRHLRAWECLFMKLPPEYLGVKAATLILAGGHRYMGFLPVVCRGAEILYAHTLDYDLYLKERDVPCAEKPLAVFLDEFLPFHPDYGVVDIKPFVGADRYYPLLNSFFDLVEEKLGLQVVIAAHPRSNYEDLPDYFKGRKCIRGRTINLVKECRLVLTHCSTAVNFAVLFNKPVMFITSSELDKSYGGYDIREFSKWFGKEQVFIDEDSNIDWEQQLTISREHYDNYRRAYIKTEHSEDSPFWQIVAHRLKKGF